MPDGIGTFETMPVGVVIRRTPGVTRWAKWQWRAVAVLPGAGHADWKEMRREGESVEFHATTLALELHRADAEAYRAGLTAEIPAIYVIMRETTDDTPLDIVLVTASPYEAQDYADSGEEIVEKVPMPAGLIAWVRDFALMHHEDEVFYKRKRDKKRTDGKQDGIGDARISQVSDVYRAPRKGRLQ